MSFSTGRLSPLSNKVRFLNGDGVLCSLGTSCKKSDKQYCQKDAEVLFLAVIFKNPQDFNSHDLKKSQAAKPQASEIDEAA